MKRKARRTSADGGRPIAAAAFKATCLELTDRVRETGEEYIVTKHGADPLDRLIVATARELGATLLSADSAILEYAAHSGNVRVQDLRR